jgi:hypothetical protein
MIEKIKRIPLREIWRNETDFSRWLSDNIDVLGEELGLSLSVIAREKAVGDFSVDLLAEDSEGQKTIIENQIEKTDHDHLGKAVTYLSNMEAKTAIWISANPRDEHVKAIKWLNEFTPEDRSFYLVKIEAIKIGDSEPAPLFTVVAEPTEISKNVGTEKKEYAERNHLLKEFWTELLAKVQGRTKLHANVNANVFTNWIGTGSGKSGISYNYAITNDYVSCELYLDKGKDYPLLNKERFDALEKNREKIENEFGAELNWDRLDNRRASRISIKFKEFGLKDRKTWEQAQEKMIGTMIKLDKVFRPYIELLK